MTLHRQEMDMPRKSWVRDLVDPGGTLPKVILINGQVKDEYQIKRIIYSGNEIGEAWMKGDKFRCFDRIAILEQGRPKGCGLATYVYAIEDALYEGVTFGTSSGSLTEDTVKIWRILRDTGVARVNREFYPVPDNKFKGNYRVYPKTP